MHFQHLTIEEQRCGDSSSETLFAYFGAEDRCFEVAHVSEMKNDREHVRLSHGRVAEADYGAV